MAFEPIPVQSYAWLAHMNPVESGLKAALQGQQIQSASLANQARAKQNQFLEPMLQEKMRQSLLANQRAQTMQQYLPQQQQAQLNLAQARLPLTQAQTAQEQERTRLMPQSLKTAMMNALSRQQQVSQSAGGMPVRKLYALAKLSSNPAMMSLIQQDPSFARSFGERLKGAVGLMGGHPQGQPSISTPTAGVQAPTTPITDEQIKAMQSATGSALAKKINTTGVLNQRMYSLSVHNMLNQLAPNMKEIAQFAGLAGKARQSADKYAASVNMLNDPSYVKFHNFTNVQAPLIANEISRAFGKNATDQESKALRHLANPVYWNSNPKLALNQFQSLINSLNANEKSLIDNPQQVKDTLRRNIQSPIQVPGISGQSPDMNIPSFNSKDEFRNWYSGLSNSQKESVKSRMGD